MLDNFSIKQLYFSLVLFCIAILGIAFISQYVFLLKPCNLCIYQRYPYMITIIVCLIALWFNSPQLKRLLLYCCIITVFIGSIIAFYHVGVEQRIFTEPLACSAETNKSTVLTIEDIRNQIFNNSTSSCSQVGFKFIGISMAGWNGIISLIISLLLLQYLHRTRNQQLF